MEAIHTFSQFETSVTVVRENGTRVDFCHMDNEFVIGETLDATGDNHHQIALSLEEAQILHQKLSTVLG